MPFSYEVVEEREEAMDFSGEKDTLKITWNKTYTVEVTATDPDKVKDVSIFNVMRASDLPVVNRSVYRSGDKIIPYVICRNKSCKRDKDRLSRFYVTTKWSTSANDDQNESDNTPEDRPASVTDITPRVESTLGEVEIVRYKDKDDKVCLTPTENFFDEPFVERVPTLELRITQYEDSISFQTMLDRKLKCNESTYRSHPRYDWIIEDVEAHEVDVELDDDSTVSAALVTYTLSYSPFLYGWKEDRALIDTHYLESDKKKAFRDDEHRTLTTGFVTTSGAKKEGDEPDYDQWEMQDTIDFDTFLRA